MLIENKGIKIHDFHIPPFDLDIGELVVFCLSKEQQFYNAEMFLKDVFNGNKRIKNVVVNQKMTFVEHFKEPIIRRLFYPISVAEYLKNNANLNSSYALKIYEIGCVNEHTKVNTLAGNVRGLLRLYSTLSKTKYVVLDIVGQDWGGVEETLKVVTGVVNEGGSVILLGSEEMKMKFGKFIDVKVAKGVKWVSPFFVS